MLSYFYRGAFFVYIYYQTWKILKHKQTRWAIGKCTFHTNNNNKKNGNWKMHQHHHRQIRTNAAGVRLSFCSVCGGQPTIDEQRCSVFSIFGKLEIACCEVNLHLRVQYLCIVRMMMNIFINSKNVYKILNSMLCASLTPHSTWKSNYQRGWR